MKALTIIRNHRSRKQVQHFLRSMGFQVCEGTALVAPSDDSVLITDQPLGNRQKKNDRPCLTVCHGLNSLELYPPLGRKKFVHQVTELLSKSGEARRRQLWMHPDLIYSKDLQKIRLNTLRAVLIQPEQLSHLSTRGHQALRQFTSKAAAHGIPIVCTSRDHNLIRPFRNLCQFFVEKESNEKIGSLSYFQDHLDALLSYRHLHRMLLHSESDLRKQLRLSKRFQEENPLSIEIALIRLKVAMTLKKKLLIQKQINHLYALNPCHPSIYISTLRTPESNWQSHLLEHALEFCPNHPQLQLELERKQFKK